jgi:LDH2 family malate/lactate/ureidoglycolate dehydrogenase
VGERYRAGALVDFASLLFVSSGMGSDAAGIIAGILVEADLMGHDTHGLAQAPGYLREIDRGEMRRNDQPKVVSDRKAAVVWDGNRLSGVWLTVKALDLASERAREYGIAAVTIRESHHIACLAAYLPRITSRNQVALILSSNPAVATVAPHGGIDPVFTPDPFAVGIPTAGDPILFDTSASITTNAMATRLRDAGQRFPAAWAQDAEGTPTDDPDAPFGGKGALLPTGGRDHGHKGYGLALAIESLTQGLSGLGRSTRPTFGGGASVYVQVFEPEAFAGFAAFSRETQALVDLCHAARPAPGMEAVRLPGERALAKKRAALANGVPLHPGIMPELHYWAQRLGVEPPRPI